MKQIKFIDKLWIIWCMFFCVLNFYTSIQYFFLSDSCGLACLSIVLGCVLFLESVIEFKKLFETD